MAQTFLKVKGKKLPLLLLMWFHFLLLNFFICEQWVRR